MAQLTWHSVTRRPKHARPLVMAHRGASDDAPENTLASFALALAQGADVLETDLRFTRDDELVLMHDATVERTTNGAGRVSDLSLSEIKKLKARKPSLRPSVTPLPHPEPVEGWEKSGSEGDHSIPTLAELLAFTPAPLALELKDARFANGDDARRLVDLLAKHGALERCAAVSFHLPLVQRLKSLAPTLPIGMITLSNPLPLYPTEFLGPLYPLIYLNPLYAWWARRLGKIVCPLDPAPEPRIKFYRRLGVTVLLTNHPARTLEALQKT